MQPGEMDVLFDVYERTEIKNSAGQIKQSWDLIGQFYGEFQPVSTANFVNSNVQGNALVARINMRPNDFPALVESHRLVDVDTGLKYDITGILPVISREKQAIMVTRGKI